MGLTSSARSNSAGTNGSYRLVPAVEVRLIDEPGLELHTPPTQVGVPLPAWYRDGKYITAARYEVVGQCGHRLAVVRAGREVTAWQERIETGKRHRRRCQHCPIKEAS